MPTKHIVLLQFVESASDADLAELFKEFAALPAKIPGITAFEAGRNNSPEGLAHGFSHAVVMTFSDDAARDAYLPHASHQAFVSRWKPCLRDVLVLDYALSSPLE